MATHLSIRLAWHDRGWDAHVCDAPHLNARCIVHQHIRDTRDDDKEYKGSVAVLKKIDADPKKSDGARKLLMMVPTALDKELNTSG